MKRLLSIRYSATSFDLAMLILRVCAGILMIPHGYTKLVNFEQASGKFLNFLGLGSTVSLSLDIFAEFFCSIFIILGLFTRLAAIPLVIAMFVAISMAHNFQVFTEGERASLFFLIFLTILFVGPGRISLDALIRK